MTKPFPELGLSSDLLKAVDKLGFEQASPIQTAAIPLLLEGKDVVGQSQTGSGKTLAFAAPAIEKVDVSLRVTQVLILCPTRELALQVTEEVYKLAFFKQGLRALPIYGGQSYDRQFYGLREGAHIVIGTPGRVMDHMRRGTLKLEALKFVVLDEVDVMLNMGFRDDIETILQATPASRQTVFFSATIPRPIQQLIEKYSRDPKSARIEQQAVTVPTVEQIFFEVDRRNKVDVLTRLIDLHDLKLGIIFCNTKRMVDDLVDHLNAQGYAADRLHGDMTQNMRDRVMNNFRKAAFEFLVATDVAARGIDVDDVEVVFNYDLPYDVEDYVHRIGRTGRAGRSGRAISFVGGRELFQINNIERFTRTKIHRAKIPTVDEVEEARTNVFLDKIRQTLKSGDFKRQDHLIERLLEEGFSSTDIASALLHQLQAGEAAPASAPREEIRRTEPPRQREERPDRRQDYREERPRFERRREERPRLERDFARPVKPERPVAKPAGKPMPPLAVVPPAIAKRPEPEKPQAQKTFTDKEILASVKNPEPSAKAESKPAKKPKASRATPEHQTRLWMNVGEEMGVTPIDVVNTIAGETGLSGKVVGTVDVRERHLFVDVADEHANAIIAKLKRAQIKGRNLKVKVA
jgi:ATP-dependent RNA helicase DeaD